MCVDTYPRELIPTAEDIRETLFERISASGWNDELFFTRNKTMQGLDIESRQCRRRTMSEVVTMPHIYEGLGGEGQGKGIMTLMAYPMPEGGPTHFDAGQ